MLSLDLVKIPAVALDVSRAGRGGELGVLGGVGIGIMIKCG